MTVQASFTVSDLTKAAEQILFNPSNAAAAAATFRIVLPQLLHQCLQTVRHQEQQQLSTASSAAVVICLSEILEITPFLTRLVT